MTNGIVAENAVKGLVGGKRRRMWKPPPHLFHEPSAAAQVSVTLPVRLREQEVQVTSTKLHTHHKDTSTHPACKHREPNAP